jgi:hypothetical protein
MTSESPQHDLRAFFRSVGSLRGGALSAPEDREKSVEDIELIDEPPLKVTSAPLPVYAVIDGIQDQMVVCFRAHRPVLLTFTSAGALSPAGTARGVREHLAIIASSADREWVDSLGTTIPLEALEGTSPPDVEAQALNLVGGMREIAERTLLRELLEQAGEPLNPHAPQVPGADALEQVTEAGGAFLVDGSLSAREADLRLIGVAKTVGKRYLPDERLLFSLPNGWRSPRFHIKAGAVGGTGRWSCYLRLQNPEHHRWSHGLVRLEAHDPSLLESACAFALADAQRPGSTDPRWDRHLRSVRAVEDYLRARKPAVFGLR